MTNRIDNEAEAQAILSTYAVGGVDPYPEHTWEHLERGVRVEYVRDVEAALPHIEADLRARIAEEIRGEAQRFSYSLQPQLRDYANGLKKAATIAERNTK
jgi:hypothetical protein